MQGPLSRFGDTAANTGMLTLMNNMESTKDLPVAAKTVSASAAAAAFRIFLMPIDTVKTTMQVTGKFSNVVKKVKGNGVPVLYHGSLAAASATFVGHYPWFFTYNFLSAKIPEPEDGDTLKQLGRRALLGFCSSAVSDTCSNSIRVVKVYKQSSEVPISYPQAVRNVVLRAASSIEGMLFNSSQCRSVVSSYNRLLE